MKTEDIKHLYDSAIQEKFSNQYEYKRWFADSISSGGYYMTKHVIESCVIPHIPEHGVICELGPGPGTWTKVILEHRPNLMCDLVDISEKMLVQAKDNLTEKNNITYIQSDFLQFKSEKVYDVFFSSRAIEYFPDKKPVIENVYSLLKKDGVCAIVTKMPRYWAYKITMRKIPEMHHGQISDKELSRILIDRGFRIIDMKPAMMTVPLFKSSVLNKFAFMLFGRMRINMLSRLFCESYCITAVKS